MSHTDADSRPEQSGPLHVVEDVVEGATDVLTKPRMRGWIHFYAAWLAIICGATLVSVSWAFESPSAGLATFIYAAATVAMFAVSATYHRVQWKSDVARISMKRLDHSMIFVFIAGSYTPFARLAMPHNVGTLVLWIVWVGAAAGILLKVLWPTAPRWVGVPLYLVLGWVAVWYAPTIIHSAGVAAMVLLVVGGVFYSVGGVLYGLRWPDPWPNTFGYHEFFHACTAIAAILHYIAMWLAVFYVDHPQL
ncbi:putative hemolysin-like protein [Mycobacterium tuberculosis H37Rv] [Mycobacterium shimoidei]|uniref:Putative hemolysin-like protein [Mycobacterium tuberculosis H37Rv] n=1 Tax=Mycobacterium shimoidei TaxID=29313 RepID=A0A375YZ06_MYCSH|nr:putative hemolysin-like protein [Mycobacterium tuberculosis H37Rv] [Mycobacterium shimoidei]